MQSAAFARDFLLLLSRFLMLLVVSEFVVVMGIENNGDPLDF